MRHWRAKRKAAVDAGPAADGDGRGWPGAMAERACCCTARAAVVVVMPPNADRPHPTELLLCGHHYRAATAALAAAGATVHGVGGLPAPGDGVEGSGDLVRAE